MCLSVCVYVAVDVPEVSVKLLVNDNDDNSDANVVIREYDKVTFICSSDASPPAHAWKYVLTNHQVINCMYVCLRWRI